MIVTQQRSSDPSTDEIRERCKLIQSEWTAEQERTARTGEREHKPYEFPVVRYIGEEDP